MEIDDLKEIIRLLKEEGLTEITLCEGERRITVRCGHGIARRGGVPPPRVYEAIYEEEGAFAVTAPLVGTFYRRPSPDEEPFVAEGCSVDPGDTLCVIEAMKVMNEIKADQPGEIEKILAKDGDPVEFGQPLFVIKRP